jgi:hypothetical protein
MAYDWNKAAEENAQAEKIPAGRHKLKVTKVIHGKKDGTKFASKSGDPQIMVIVSDNQDREASMMITLSEAAAWVLARLLKAAGADVEKMTKMGITPGKFADEKFASAQLLSRVFTAEVSYEKGQDGKEYARINPLRSAPAEEPATDEIPI